jgi:hypothetical protein
MIHLAAKGRRLGGFTLPAVANFVGGGDLSADVHFWREGMDDWQPIEGLALEPRPPASAQSPPRMIIVLGMHRSGTSCLAGLLQASGVYLGGPSSFMAGAGPQNPKGFWERREIRKICDTLLFSAGFDWDRVAGLDAAEIRPEVVEQQRKAFLELRDELASHHVSALKEPRLCFLWPLFADLAGDAVILHIHRHPARVASSLATRNNFPLPYGLALWEAYNRAALRATAGQKVHRLSYEDLVGHPAETVARLRETLRETAGIELRELDADELREVVDPDLCRENLDPAEGDTWLNGAQKELLDVLRSPDEPGPGGHHRLCVETLQAFEPLYATAALPSQKPVPSPLGHEPEDKSITVIDAAALADAAIDRGEETVVIMPSITEERAIGTARLLVKQAGLPTRVFVVMDRERQGFIKTFNDTAAKVSAAYVVYLAEDVYPGREWLKIARETLHESGKGLLAVNDSKWRGHIASYGLVRTSWARGLYDGPLFFPGYRDHVADIELTLLARAADQFVYESESVLVEIDPDKVLHGTKVFAMKSHPPDVELLRERFDQAFGGLVSAERLKPLRSGYALLATRRHRRG